MNLRDLKYLAVLADCQHFGKAAELCFVSQPALSMQIKKLEGRLEVCLIERTSKTFLLTEVGSRIAHQARQIIAKAEEIKSIAKVSKDIFSGDFKIGIIPTLCAYLLPHLMSPLSKHYPNLKFYLTETQTEVLIEQLTLGKIDVAFLAAPVDDADFATEPLFDENFLLGVYKTHSLAKQKSVKLSQLKNNEILLLEEGHCMRDSTLELCTHARAHENTNFRGTSLETLRHMVATNAGITLMPALACVKQKNITYLPIEQCKLHRQILLVSRKNFYRNKLVKDIAQQIRKILTTQKAVKVIS